MEEYKNWEDLNFDERVKVLEGFKNTEDRNESDRDNPRDKHICRPVKDYYEDNAEKFGFAVCEHGWVSIAELIVAVDNSDMDTEVKTELNTILKLYVDVAGLISKGDW